jgi:SAM-dependent methyltransferase
VLDVQSTDTPDRFAIDRCARCGVMRTTPVPDALAPYYATDLAATMTRHGSRAFAALRRVQLGRELRRITRHGDPGTIADVGCGAGDFARAAARRRLRVVSADAAATAPPALGAMPYVRFDFETYRFDGLRPDTVVLRHVLEHVRDPYACLAGLRRQGARQLYVVVPDAGSREARLLGRHWYLWDPPRHLWHFDRDSLGRLCERAGLVVAGAGTDVASILTPSLYRRLRVGGWPPWLYGRFGPTATLAALAAPLDRLLGSNVLWVVARWRGG